MRGLAFGGWGRGLALGKQRRRTLKQVRLLTREQMMHPMGCVCDDKQCAVCTPEPEPKWTGSMENGVYDNLLPETIIRLRLVPKGLKCVMEGCGDANAVYAYMTDDEEREVIGFCEEHHNFVGLDLTIIDEFEAQRRERTWIR